MILESINQTLKHEQSLFANPKSKASGFYVYLIKQSQRDIEEWQAASEQGRFQLHQLGKVS